VNPDRVYAEYLHAKTTARKERQRLKQLRGLVRAAMEAQALIQAVAAEVQGKAQRKVSALVSRCLREVFGEHAYLFRLKLEAKRGKTEARPVFVRDGKELDPVDESGLGQVDVAAFALRLAALLLHNPPVRRMMVLDEPFKWVSEEYLPRVRDLLEALATELGVQIVMSTHLRELEVGNVIRID
jgi:DNA repair exonuclease SbcCD ATPase subunit